MKKQKLKKWFSKKPLLIFLGIFVGVGIAAQLIISGGVTIPPNCVGGPGDFSNLCRKAHTKGSTDSFGDPLDSFVVKTQNNEFFKVTNHSGELVAVNGDYTHSHSSGGVGHSHPGPIASWVAGSGNTHSHTGLTTTDPSSSQHATIVAGGFVTTPERGYHEMETGTLYAGKWIGINMNIDGSPDYHVYETKPKKLFVPNKDKKQIAKFINATRKAGDATYTEADVTATGTAAVADGQIAYDTNAPQLGGIEVCKVADAGSTECIFECGNAFTDNTGTNAPQTYGTIEIGGKCWFTDDLNKNELTASQLDEFEKAAGVSSWISSPAEVISVINSVPNQAYPEIWNLCQDISGSTADYVTKIGGYAPSGSVSYPSFSLECYDEDTPVGVGTYYSKTYIQGTSQGFDNTSGKYYLSGQIIDNTCPTGWHLPTNQEWEEMETAKGLTAWTDIDSNNDYIVTNLAYSETKNIAKTNTILTALGWNSATNTIGTISTPVDHYLSRDRFAYTDGRRVHVAREWFESSPSNTLINITRDLLIHNTNDDNDDINFVKNSMPIPLQWLISFIPEVHAAYYSPEKSLLRCVQGDTSKNWTTGAWGAWSSCSGGSQTRTRTRTCHIGDASVPANNYPVHPDHCLNESGMSTPLDGQTQTCSGGGLSS